MTKLYTIEHKVSKPKEVEYGLMPKLAKQMKPGDSVVVHYRDIAALRMALRRNGLRLHHSRYRDKELPLEHMRCWAVEKE